MPRELHPNAHTWQDAMTRIRIEYTEMPDLNLTPRQIRRLCGLPQEACDAAVASLVRSGFLCESRHGTLLRNGLGRRS
jgi:hypothetical protein